MSDLINRQDAIVNMAFAIWHYPNELYTSLNCFDNCQELAERALNRLPSTEPEIIRCRNCKYYILSRDGERYCFNHDDDTLWQDDDFCSRAELRGEQE